MPNIKGGLYRISQSGKNFILKPESAAKSRPVSKSSSEEVDFRELAVKGRDKFKAFRARRKASSSGRPRTKGRLQKTGEAAFRKKFFKKNRQLANALGKETPAVRNYVLNVMARKGTTKGAKTILITARALDDEGRLDSKGKLRRDR